MRGHGPANAGPAGSTRITLVKGSFHQYLLDFGLLLARILMFRMMKGRMKIV